MVFVDNSKSIKFIVSLPIAIFYHDNKAILAAMKMEWEEK